MIKEKAKTSKSYSNRDAWVESFYKYGNKELWLLDHTEDKRICIFYSKEKIISGRFGNEDMLGRSPVWHVWFEDKWLYCGSSMKDAYSKYKELCKQYKYVDAVEYW